MGGEADVFKRGSLDRAWTGLCPSLPVQNAAPGRQAGANPVLASGHFQDPVQSLLSAGLLLMLLLLHLNP